MKKLSPFEKVRKKALLTIYDSDPDEHLSEFSRSRLLWLMDGLFSNVDSITDSEIISIVDGTRQKIRDDEDYRNLIRKRRGFGKKVLRQIFGWAGIEVKSPRQERIEVLLRRIEIARKRRIFHNQRAEYWRNIWEGSENELLRIRHRLESEG